MHSDPPTDDREYGWPWIALLAAALLPLTIIAFFAAPQTDDFCYGAIALQDGWAGIWHHYATWSGRLVASALIPLPSILSDRLGIDLLTVYACFAVAFLLGFGALCYWLVGRLRPASAQPSRLFLALALFIAMVANAPTPRHMLFWMPGAFTYTLPAVVVLALFMVLYRALAERTPLSASSVALLVPALLLAALCNELAGPIAALMLGLSWHARRRLRLDRVQTVPHAALIAAALAGALIVYLAPGNLVRQASTAAGASLLGALFRGTLALPAFVVLHLPRPGVVGWFVLLALSVADTPAAATDRRAARIALRFALLTMLGACWGALVAGYYGQGTSLPARALNPLFVLSLLCLSCALCLAPQLDREHPIARLVRWLSRPSRRAMRAVGMALLLLSPALLVSFWELPQAPAYRRETRAQLLAISSAPAPTVYVAQIATTPRLLFNNRLTTDGSQWPNKCLARYYGKEMVLPLR